VRDETEGGDIAEYMDDRAESEMGRIGLDGGVEANRRALSSFDLI
jgi:hypothetical protein